MMKKGFFYSHPILAGLIAMAIVSLICNGIAGILMTATTNVSISPDQFATEEEMKAAFVEQVMAGTDVFNGTVTVLALICLFVFCWLNRKNGYRGLVKIQSSNVKDVWICIAIFAVVDIIGEIIWLLSIPGGIPPIPAPTVSILIMALYAGINEEAICRAIPGAVMLRNKPDSRRIWVTVLLTAVIFGFVHMINLGSGQTASQTGFQVFFAICMGVFFAAIYLRTGSIALPIVVHTLHDLMVFILKPILPAEPTNAFLMVVDTCVAVLPLVLGIVMLLPKNHADMVETWTKIWPEKNKVEG